MWHQLWSSSTVSTTISASCAAGRAGARGEHARPAPAAAAAPRARGSSRAVPPSWETPMTSPPRRRVEGELERLGRRRPSRRRRAIPAARIASRRISTVAERGVLARAAAGDDDRRARARRLPDRAREPPGAALGIGEAVQDPAGHARLGRDHLGHVVRRAVPVRRLRRRRPGRRGRRQLGGRIEGHGSHSSELAISWHSSPTSPPPAIVQVRISWLSSPTR